MLVHILLALIGVVDVHDALEHVVGKLKLTDAAHEVLANVDEELIVALGYKLTGEAAILGRSGFTFLAISYSSMDTPIEE
mgnify:CR=1 FL=1